MNRKHVFPRLVGFELRKAFCTPWMLLFLLLLLVMNGWKLGTAYAGKTAFWRDFPQAEPVYQELYNRFCGEITTEKIGNLMETYGPLKVKKETIALDMSPQPDSLIYSEMMDEKFLSELFYTPMAYNCRYAGKAQEIVNKAVSLSRQYAAMGNLYESSKNAAIALDFFGRHIDIFGDTRQYELLFSYDYSSMLILLLSIFGLSGVFVLERETEMTMLLGTTRRGGVATTAAKLTASLLFTFFLCLLFYAQDFLTLHFLAGRPESLDAPIYTLRFLEATPLRMTIRQYFLWASAMRTLGMIGCGCLILLVSAMTRRVLSAFSLSLALLVGEAFLAAYSHTRFFLKWFNPLELVLLRDNILENRFVNLFGRAVHLHHFVLAGNLLVMVVLCLGILKFSKVGRRVHRGRL